jgi:protein-L-isoaspartate(D-aspartate) O-methyltransferase
VIVLLWLLIAACSETAGPATEEPLPPVADPPEMVEAREKMVEEQVKRIGVTAVRVLEAFRRVPRHAFLPEGLWSAAYHDRALRRPDGETITAPDLSGAMLQTLELSAESRVLECGTRSGWLTALLAAAAGEVFTVDARPDASRKARRTLASLSIDNVHFRVGDPLLGCPEEGPFDAIVVNGAVPHVPRNLYESLAQGGRIVAPVGVPGENQTLIVVEQGDPEPRKTRAVLSVRFGLLARPATD